MKYTSFTTHSKLGKIEEHCYTLIKFLSSMSPDMGVNALTLLMGFKAIIMSHNQTLGVTSVLCE